MGLQDFFEEMDRKRNDGYERSLAKYNEQKAIEQKAEMQALLPKSKKTTAEVLAGYPQVIEYKGKGNYREFKITAKDGRSVIVRHPDHIEASNIGEDFLKVVRYSAERVELYRDPIWDRPVPPDGNPYLSPADGVVLDIYSLTYTLKGYPMFTGAIHTSTKTWPGHHYVHTANGDLRWIP